MMGEYYKTKASAKEYIKLAKGIDGKQLIDQFAKVLPAQSKLLEIGSGPGSDWKILNKAFKVTGSDNSKEFLRHLRTENPDGHFLELDAVTLDTDKKFDGIYSNKVMHHLNDAELLKSIRRQCEILKPSGIICHSFWKGEGFEVFKGLFVNYHNEESLTEIFQPYVELMSVQHYKEFEDGDSILIIGKRK